jgi:Phytoene dehydrogenase and related proteins
MIEMVLPSSLDNTLSPPGHHVCLLFTQFTPYKLAGDRDWTEEDKANYATNVFSSIEQYCPGFTQDIVGYEILTPPDLEKEFGLTGGVRIEFHSFSLILHLLLF